MNFKYFFNFTHHHRSKYAYIILKFQNNKKIIALLRLFLEKFILAETVEKRGKYNVNVTVFFKKIFKCVFKLTREIKKQPL